MSSARPGAFPDHLARRVSVATVQLEPPRGSTPEAKRSVAHALQPDLRKTFAGERLELLLEPGLDLVAR